MQSHVEYLVPLTMIKRKIAYQDEDIPVSFSKVLYFKSCSFLVFINLFVALIIVDQFIVNGSLINQLSEAFGT